MLRPPRSTLTATLFPYTTSVRAHRINHQRKAARTSARPTLHRILFGHQQRQFIIEHKIAGGEARMIDKRVFDHVDIGSAQGSEKPLDRKSTSLHSSN